MQQKYCILFLLFISLCTAYFTSGLLMEGYPSGGDNVSHYDLLLNTKEALHTFFQTGNLPLWNPDYYMGFPMFFFYTPLPYFFLALLCFIPGISSLFLFKCSIVFFFSLLPLLFYFAARIMELETEFAFGIALFSTALSSTTVFGLEYYSFFATGLYAQLWGVVFLPFAFAYSYRYFVLHNPEIPAHNKNNLFKSDLFKSDLFKSDLFFAVLFLFLTFLSHIFTGIIAFFLVSFLFIAQLFQKIQMKEKKVQIEITKKYFILLFFFFLSVCFFIIPYLLNQDYFGNITFDSDFKEQGYGILQTAHFLLSGDLLDYSFSFSRFPILTVLFFFGIFFSFFWKEFKSKHPLLPLFLLLSLSWSLICIAGKVSFSFLAFIPVLSSLQTFRFITLFHFVALFYIGIALFWIFSSIQSYTEPYTQSYTSLLKKRYTSFLLFGFLLLLLIPVFSERIKTFQEYSVTYTLEQNTNYWHIVSQILKAEKTKAENTAFSTRLYITSPTGLYDLPQQLQALPLVTKKPIFASAGIGGHDSLSAYYSSLPIISDAPYLVDILGIDTIIDKKQGSETLTLYTATNATGYFALGTAPIIVATTAVSARDVVVEWLFSPLPLSHVFLQIDPTASQDSLVNNFLETNSLETNSLENNSFSNTSLILIQDILDQGDVFLLTEIGSFMQHRIQGQLNLERASPLATITNSDSPTETYHNASIFNYFQNSSFTEQNCGSVLEESQKKRYGSTIVFVPPFVSSDSLNSFTQCYVIFKMTYHPEWHVFVDGTEQKLIMMSPSFMGVAVPSGTHEVVFSYKIFWYRKVLFLISILSLFGLFFIEKYFTIKIT